MINPHYPQLQQQQQQQQYLQHHHHDYQYQYQYKYPLSYYPLTNNHDLNNNNVINDNDIPYESSINTHNNLNNHNNNNKSPYFNNKENLHTPHDALLHASHDPLLHPSHDPLLQPYNMTSHRDVNHKHYEQQQQPWIKGNIIPIYNKPVTRYTHGSNTERLPYDNKFPLCTNRPSYPHLPYQETRYDIGNRLLQQCENTSSSVLRMKEKDKDSLYSARYNNNHNHNHDLGIYSARSITPKHYQANENCYPSLLENHNLHHSNQHHHLKYDQPAFSQPQTDLNTKIRLSPNIANDPIILEIINRSHNLQKNLSNDNNNPSQLNHIPININNHNITQGLKDLGSNNASTSSPIRLKHEEGQVNFTRVSPRLCESSLKKQCIMNANANDDHGNENENDSDELSMMKSSIKSSLISINPMNCQFVSSASKNVMSNNTTLKSHMEHLNSTSFITSNKTDLPNTEDQQHPSSATKKNPLINHTDTPLKPHHNRYTAFFIGNITPSLITNQGLEATVDKTPKKSHTTNDEKDPALVPSKQYLSNTLTNPTSSIENLNNPKHHSLTKSKESDSSCKEAQFSEPVNNTKRLIFGIAFDQDELNKAIGVDKDNNSNNNNNILEQENNPKRPNPDDESSVKTSQAVEYFGDTFSKMNIIETIKDNTSLPPAPPCSLPLLAKDKPTDDDDDDGHKRYLYSLILHQFNKEPQSMINQKAFQANNNDIENSLSEHPGNKDPNHDSKHQDTRQCTDGLSSSSSSSFLSYSATSSSIVQLNADNPNETAKFQSQEEIESIIPQELKTMMNKTFNEKLTQYKSYKFHDIQALPTEESSTSNLPAITITTTTTNTTTIAITTSISSSSSSSSLRKIDYANGIIYEGEMKSSIPEGYGILKTNEGDMIYEGNWHQGKYHGKGKENNNACNGGVSNDSRGSSSSSSASVSVNRSANGGTNRSANEGANKCANGGVNEGANREVNESISSSACCNGLREPNSRQITYESMNFIKESDIWVRYEGDFKDGKWEGNGKLLFINDEEYYGEFKANQMNGKGSYYLLNGDIVIGIWENGRIIKKIQ